MQTFLPFPDFLLSVRVLDNRRLGKQRVEAYTILRTLEGKTLGWAAHPAVKMWKGYEQALALYMNLCIEEWVCRGFRNTMKKKEVQEPIIYPPWFGDPAFHASHRSNLLRKDPDFYGQYGWKETPDLPYVWPSLGN